MHINQVSKLGQGFHANTSTYIATDGTAYLLYHICESPTLTRPALQPPAHHASTHPAPVGHMAPLLC